MPVVMKSNKTSEKVIERRLVELIKLRKGLCIKLLTYQFIGLPDRMCLFPGGKIVFVELKSTGKKPTKIQIAVHKMLKNLGFRVEVIDTIEGVEKLIAEV